MNYTIRITYSSLQVWTGLAGEGLEGGNPNPTRSKGVCKRPVPALGDLGTGSGIFALEEVPLEGSLACWPVLLGRLVLNEECKECVPWPAGNTARIQTS